MRYHDFKVYPRTHGETLSEAVDANSRCGLSPYTRGNPVDGEISNILARSIPVHTGKPLILCLSSAISWVYPRTHGETTNIDNDTGSRLGLSPYTRGNLIFTVCQRRIIRSIPVHTGKPERLVRTQRDGRVYPRTHGETKSNSPALPTPKGLSPYTRGNQETMALQDSNVGSIPVHTGKPLGIFWDSIHQKVYPRTHGETYAKPFATNAL